MNKQVLKEIAIEQKKSFDAVEKGIRRDLLGKIKEYSRLPQIVVLTGIRRCGKSTLLRQSMDFLGNKGYYFNFEDERLLGFEARSFNDLYEVFLELYGEKKLFFFDEIQNVVGWERFVRRMYDNGSKFYITGSNASLLSRELGTRLTGRYVSVDLQPFSFGEYLKFSGYDLRTGDFLETKKRAKIKRHFNAYLKKGGMPEYLKFGNAEALKKVYNDILYRDVVAKFGVEDIKALRELSFYLISNLASPYTYNSLKKFLGLGSFNTVKSYIDHLENSLLLYSVNLFSRSLKQQSVSARKIYAADNGLANAVSFKFSADRGKYLENVVFLELKRRGAEIFYYKTKSNLEVDFFTRGKEKNLIQVSWDLSQEKTKKREFKALLEAMDEQKIKSGLILTDSEEGEEIIEKKKIIIKPVWKWLLEK
jgi:uncharacterized protein